MYNGNCALKIDSPLEDVEKKMEINPDVVNMWLSSNLKRMKMRTIQQPSNWAEGGSTCWGI